MKVILKEEVRNLGIPGDVVKVADGYARNYLIPKKLVLKATSNNLKKIEDIKKIQYEKKQEQIEKAKIIIDKLENVKCKFKRRADENGHLYGSVDENDIVESLSEMNIFVKKNNVIMDKHLKELGDHEVSVNIQNTDGTVKVSIQPYEEENKEEKE